MTQPILEEESIAKAEAIVSVFETGKLEGDYSAVAVLNDAAGVSYGIKQFTHRSGSLRQVVERYLGSGGTIGREIMTLRLALLRKTTKAAIDKLAGDDAFKKALKSAAVTPEMREAQEAVARERYMEPAIRESVALGFELPLSLAVVYDSMVHGSWQRLRDSIGPSVDERKWIKEYVEERHEWLRSVPRLKGTSYRTDFFLKQIERDNWELLLPVRVHGVLLKDEYFKGPETTASQPPAAIPPDSLPDPHQTGRDLKVAAPAKTLDEIEARVNAAAARVDQVERVITTTTTRTDKAKSLWTTIAGTLWQMLWALIGVIGNVPREVWLVVAVIVGALMLLFLYRQIVLGRVRENFPQIR